MAQKFFINTQANDISRARLVSFFSSASTGAPQLVRGDDLDIELHLLQPSTSGVRPWDYIDPTSDTVVFRIGSLTATPTGGTFTLTDPTDSETTAPIACDATASEIQSALRTGCPENYSNATVTGSDGNFVINAGDAAPLTALTASAANLTPAGSRAELIVLQEGSGSVPEITALRLRFPLVAEKSTAWTPLPAAAVTLSVLQTGSATQNAIQRAQWNADAYAGLVSLAWSDGTTTASFSLDYNTTAADFEAAFETHPGVTSGDISVTRVAAGDYLVEFTGTLALTNVANITLASQSLSVPVGLAGTLDLSTPGASALLAAASSAATVIEIEHTSGGSERTIWQAAATLYSDLIP